MPVILNRVLICIHRNNMNVNVSEIVQPLNLKVLHYLTQNHSKARLFALPDTVVDPYNNCGSHPDVVHVIWDVINPALPSDCRGLVYGCPTLVQPNSGVILAIGIGTDYCLRLPGELGIEAIKLGAKTFIKWTAGNTMDVRGELGEDWVSGFGGFTKLVWCKQVYEMFNQSELYKPTVARAMPRK